jgi:hypothetical protein
MAMSSETKPAEGTMEAAAPAETPMARPLSLAELPENVHVLSVGYDSVKLEPVVNAIVKATEMAKAAKPGGLEPLSR